MKIVLASSNEHKVKEINAIVSGSGIEFVLPPAGFDPVEDGETFEVCLVLLKAVIDKESRHLDLAAIALEHTRSRPRTQKRADQKNDHCVRFVWQKDLPYRYNDCRM